MADLRIRGEWLFLQVIHSTAKDSKYISANFTGSLATYFYSLWSAAGFRCPDLADRKDYKGPVL